MLVVDASAVVELLLSTPVGTAVGAALLDGEPTLHAPELLGVEVVSVLRRLVRMNEITGDEAQDAVYYLGALGVEFYEHIPLLSRMLVLRDSLSAYDAAYVALAEALGAPLITCDSKLAAAHGHDARITLVKATTR